MPALRIASLTDQSSSPDLPSGTLPLPQLRCAPGGSWLWEKGGAGLHLYFSASDVITPPPTLPGPALSPSAVGVGEAGGGKRRCSLSWRYPELGLAGASGRSAGVERAEGSPVTPTRTGLCVPDVLCSGSPFPSPRGQLRGSADGSHPGGIEPGAGQRAPLKNPLAVPRHL